MFQVEKICRAVLTVLATAALGACGGGGGGGNPEPDPTPQTLRDIITGDNTGNKPVEPKILSVTSDNYSLVTYLMLLSAKATNDAQEMTAGLTLLGAGFTMAGQQEYGVPATVACEAGGTTTTDINDKDGDGTLSAGDDFKITDNDCVSEGGLMSDGVTAVKIVRDVDAVEETDPTLLEMQMVYTDASTTNSLGTTRLEGEVNIVLTGQDYSDGTSVGGSVVEIPRLVSEDALVQSTISDYRGKITRTTLDSAQTEQNITFVLEASGSVSDSRVGGYTLSTPVPVEGYDVGLPGFPVRFFAGTFEALFDDGRRVKITAIDETNARIEADLDTDGRYELSRGDTWDDLATAYFEWVQTP